MLCRSFLQLRLNRIALAVLGTFMGFVTPIVIAADESEYKPPGNFYSIQAHFAWCAEGKTSSQRIKRYEGFWSQQAPESPEWYDDSLHARLVRRCAYRLAELYVQAGRTKDCLKMLKRLESEDDNLKP